MPGLAALCELHETAPNVYESVHPLFANLAGIVYGGCTLGIAVAAACKSSKSNHTLYSCMGNFLGPAYPDRPLRCTVRPLRDTRAFTTRQVEVTQDQVGGGRRTCLLMLADFHTTDAAAALEYSTPPSMGWSSLDKSLTIDETSDAAVKRGDASQKQADLNKTVGNPIADFYERRLPPEGLYAQKLSGFAPQAKSPQDRLPAWSRRSADWFRSAHEVNEVSEQYGGLAFIMDGLISLMALFHSGLGVQDASAFFSLDFAMRIFVPVLNINDWHLREFKTITAGSGTTYSESYAWNSEGKMVATMTQQGIVRLRPDASSRL